jgi:radical SAM protein with 4Fe4S-binding SPASM domain
LIGMAEWQDEWGPRPERKVTPYWWPPSLIMRQAASAILVGSLTRWKKMPTWFVKYCRKALPGAAGSLGMGCIGFPAHAVWEMTNACNLKCIHCHASGGKKGDELSTEEAKILIDQLAEIPEFRMLAFTGGEPLVRPDLFELLAYSKALGFTNTIATNATLIDDETAMRLKQHGVVIAAVSLDGFNAETHDMIRGKTGIFEATLEGIRALNKAGILLHINITVMDYNLPELDKMMSLIEELNAGILLIYQLVPVGRGRDISDVALDIDGNERLMQFMVKAQSEAKAIIEPVAGTQYWSHLLNQAGIKSGPLMWLAEKVLHGCSAGRGFVYIKPNGDVWPCPFIEVSSGNIKDKPFTQIWADSPVFKELRNRETLLEGSCGACEYKKICGGCRGRAWAYTGNYMAEDPLCFIHPPSGEE